ncbi:cytochrome P450 [Amycolatopsis sp. CA-161197]|uniref:cytochrome P450 n=1 Tax=Amycolatopsis sp. CA-161197 TaxID=3239922 RepID=UPI003D8D3DCB
MSEPWVVRGHAEVKRLFADPRLEPLPARDPAEHRRMRRLLSGAFAARRLAVLRGDVDALAERLLAELSSPPVDFHAAFSDPFPELVIRRLLGAPPGEDLADVARFKLGHPADDLLSELVREVPPAEAARYATLLLYAGHVTTTTAIDKGVVLLDRHPAHRAAVWADPSLVPGAVEEILRFPLHPPNGGRPRRATAGFDLGDHRVEAGDVVLLSAVAANLDETEFPGAHEFDVHRDATGHLAFGHGPYYCLGAPLARLELQAVFTALPRLLPDLHLAVPAGELRLRADVGHTAFAELPVTW